MNNSIAVFKAEIEAGLADAVRDAASIAYLSAAKRIQPTETVVRQAQAALQQPIDDHTLIYFEDILASSGWNDNNDIFLHEEFWPVRHTIAHKPINIGHKYTNIVGHVVGSIGVDAEYNLIDDAIALDDLPEKFHVKNQSVLYRHIGDADHDDAMAILEADIEAGKYFVSMEVFFKGFDYGLIDEDDGSQFVARRDSSTAFLTKHLIQYGGAGRWVDAVGSKAYRVGRVLKNMHFKGKGLVETPGNPDSIIFPSSQAFRTSYADLGYLNAAEHSAASQLTQEKPQMSEPTSDAAAGLQAELDAARKRIASLEAEIQSASAKDHQSQIASLQDSLQARDTQITELTTEKSGLTAEVAELTAKLGDAETKLADAETSLATIAAERKTAARIAALTDKGADKATAELLVKNFETLSDEAFAASVEALAPSWAKSETDAEAAAEPDPSPAPTAPTAAERAEAEKTAISNAKLEDQPALSVAEAGSAAEARRQSVIEYMTKHVYNRAAGN